MKIPEPRIKFCAEIDGFLISVQVALMYTVGNKRELKKILKFLTAMYLLQQYSVHDTDEKIDTKELNRIIQKHLGSGHTWVSCTQFLAGAKAQEINEKYQDLISGIGGIRLSLLAEYALPDMQKNIDKILYSKTSDAT